jgi:predicted ATPase
VRTQAAVLLARLGERRRFGPGPYLLGLERDPDVGWGTGFPADVPAVAGIHELRLDAPVTLLAGDNGAGKSTIVEAIAEAIGFGDEGGELVRADALPAVPRPALERRLLPVLSGTKPRGGYYLRAESFFNVARYMDEDPDGMAPDLSLYGDTSLHAQSHGQSFLALAEHRFGGEGLFLLDEPEAALSVTGALALLTIVARAARAGAQFLIATHSPILLACPGATIYELDERGIAPCAYDDLDAVRLTRGFLAAPERYLRAALEDDGR